MQQIEATVCMFRIGLHGWQKRVNDLMAKGWILVSDPDKIIEHRWLGLRMICKAVLQLSPSD